MAVLQGFPMVSQLTTVTDEVGEISNNAQFDCVAASIDAACRYLLTMPENSVFDPDNFKDKAYSDSYKGGTSAEAYIPFCASLGVRLYPLQGMMPSQLVAEAHKLLQAQKPVVFTEPDPYASASLGWTHVCCFFAEGPGYLVAMDPYIAKAIKRTDQEWAQLLLDNEIWILERMEENVTIDIHNTEVAKHFKELDTQHWLCLSTGKIVQFAMLDAYRKYGNTGLCGLTFLGLPQCDEVVIGPRKVRQNFEYGVLCADDTDGKGWTVYPLPLYTGGAGTDPAIPELEAQITQLKSLQGVQPDPLAEKALSVIRQIKPLVAPF